MKKHILDKLTAEPGKKHNIGDFSTHYTGSLTKKEAEKGLQETVEKMTKLQTKLYAFDRYSMLIVFQAMDAGGKDGTIKHVMSGINPQGCQVVAFKQPSTEDLDHDYLWRVYKKLPELGRIGIFNRSHYEEVIVTKVHPELLLKQKLVGIRKVEDIDDKFWERRYRQINDFEKYLSENGVVIVKFFLNVSRHEQEKRFRDRLADENENWKFSLADVKESSYWDYYMKAYSDMLSHTSTDHAPWYVIPADHKWYMRHVVADIICDRMERLNLSYPEMTDEKRNDLAEAMDIINSQLAQKPSK